MSMDYWSINKSQLKLAEANANVLFIHHIIAKYTFIKKYTLFIWKICQHLTSTATPPYATGDNLSYALTSME